MKFRIKSNIFATVSMILAVIVWTIVCYMFIVNSMFLMSIAISHIKGPSHLVDIQDALSLVLHFIRMICEGALVASLTIQFLSSYDLVTCDCDNDEGSYAANWRKCHTTVLITNSAVLIIILGLFIVPMNFDLIYEVFAVTFNVIFLITRIIVFALDPKLQQSLPFESISDSSSNVDEGADVTRTNYNLNIRSFLDHDPIKDTKSAIVV